MSLTPRIYTYLFFRVSPEYQNGEKEEPGISLFFKEWMNVHGLKECQPDDMKDPNLLMHRLAAGKDMAICIIRFHDIDIFEIQQRQVQWGDPFEFWTKSMDALRLIPRVPPYFGSARVLFSPRDINLSQKADIEKKYAKFPQGQMLYDMGNHNYLFFSPQSPNDFLDRDFPVMLSCMQKLSFENEQLRKIKVQNIKSEQQIQDLLAVNRGEEIEKRFPKIKEHQSYFQRNTARLTKLRETLDINILNLTNYCNKHGIGDSPLFASILKQVQQSQKQAEYDLNYARAGGEEMDSHLRFLHLKIQNQRLKVERRIECLIMVIAAFLGIGGATTNMSDEFDKWLIRLILMGLGSAFVIFLWWCFSRKQD